VSEPEFSIERNGAVAIVTLSKPNVGNALSGTGAIGLADIFDGWTADADGVRAVLIRAEGRQFCTGADLSNSQSEPRTEQRPVNGHMVRQQGATHHRLIASVFHCPLPTIAAVQGAALGFGLHLALATDFVFAGERASFAEPFSDRGFSVDSGGSWLLPRLIGLTRAKRLLYLGDRIDAETAAAWGLIAEVVGDEELDAISRERAQELANRPTQALAATKRLLQESSGATLEQALHAESMAVELTLRSNDFKEGMKAFASKRPPEFTGT
jgi:2-(1,2-epoxy-1,2-dihydrophenyl)acetyl-CoA isomerase